MSRYSQLFEQVHRRRQQVQQDRVNNISDLAETIFYGSFKDAMEMARAKAAEYVPEKIVKNEWQRDQAAVEAEAERLMTTATCVIRDVTTTSITKETIRKPIGQELSRYGQMCRRVDEGHKQQVIGLIENDFKRFPDRLAMKIVEYIEFGKRFETDVNAGTDYGD